MLRMFWVMLNFTLDPSFKVKLGWVSLKVPISRLLLVLEVSNVHLTFRKPYAGNLLVMSDLTLDPSFKVKLGRTSKKMPISHLLLVCNVQQTFWKSYALDLLVMSDLTLDCSLKVKLGRVHIRCHILFIIGSRGF